MNPDEKSQHMSLLDESAIVAHDLGTELFQDQFPLGSFSSFHTNNNNHQHPSKNQITDLS